MAKIMFVLFGMNIARLFGKVEEVRWCKVVKILFWQKIHIIWMDILVAFYLISLLLGCN